MKPETCRRPFFLACLNVSALLLAVFASGSSASAEQVNAQVMADFNGYKTVSGQNILSGENYQAQNYGIDVGLVTTGTRDWLGGTSGPHLLAGSLTESVAVPGYAIVQQPGATSAVVRVYSTANAALRQAYRDLSLPMAGAIWGSFLLQQSKTESEDNAGTPVFQKTGLTFNIKNIDPDAAAYVNRNRIYAHGANLVLNGTSATGADAVTVPSVFTAGQTALVLFRHDTVSKQTDLWVNPAAVPGNPALLLSASNATYSGVIDLFGTSSLASIGVGGNYFVDTGSPGSSPNGRSGDLDAIRFDSSPHAYYAVTGVPTPPDFPRAPVIADFNDTAVGALGSASSTTNDNKGTGFSSAKWDGSANATALNSFSALVATGAEDLVAPASTRYAIVQSGPPRCVWGNNSTITYIRGAWRTLASPLSGEVWGSFLVQNGKPEHTAGLSFNLFGGGGGTPSPNRSILAVGTSLVVYNYGGTKVADVPNAFTLGETALVLFRINTTTQHLTVWVNPVLPDNIAGLDALTPAYDAPTVFVGTAGTSLERIGVIVTGGQNVITSSADKIDAIYLASGSAGYYAVTGLVAKPIILSQPQSQTLTTGDTATFTVSATSQWPLTYQWMHGGTAINTATTGTLTLSNIQTGNAGAYQVMVSHDGGIGCTMSDAAVLTVGTPEPLVINSGPTISPSTTVGAGDTVTMTISATGNPPLTYQWLKGGTSIAGATSATFVINSAVVGDAGNYSVIVDDPVNAPLTSGTVTLTVVGPPSILTQPSGITVTKGSPASFTVSATCTTGPIAYQWFHNGAEITGATAATYSLSFTDTTDAGGYSVKVSNASAPAHYVMSSIATLKVNLVDILDAPVVVDFNDHVVGALNAAGNIGSGIGFDTTENNWPINTSIVQITSGDLTAPAGTRYGFTQSGNARSFTAISATDYTRQNTRKLAVPLSGLVWGSFLVQHNLASNITGLTFNYANNSTTPTERCRLAAEGTSLVAYGASVEQKASAEGVLTLGQTALVLFSYDTITKRLRVWVNPVLPDTAPGVETLTPEIDTTLDIMTNVAPHATPSLERIGVMGRTVAGKSAVDPLSNGFLDSLRLASGSDGYYRVTGISIPPIIFTQPASQVVDVGQPATFTVSATGVGELGYQWWHSGTVLAGATGSSFNIPATVRDDRGLYNVVVSHLYGVGSVTSGTASLVFRDELVPLTVSTPILVPSSIVHTGTAVSMSVIGSGYGNISYQWMQNGMAVTGATSGTYAIDPVAVTHTGEYYAIVSDDAGRIASSGTLSLTVLGPPIILTQPASQTVHGAESVTFSVSATSTVPLTYQWYFGNAQIVGATGASHVIQSAQMSDTGGYSVHVSLADYPEYFTRSSTAALTVLPTDIRSAPVVADFNDFPSVNTDIKAVANTGAGFGESNWSTTTGAIQTIAGDLTPLSLTRYGIHQPVDAPHAARSVYLNNTGAIMRVQERNLATPLSGVVWGSFLVNNTSLDHKTGVTFNLNKADGSINDTTGPFTRWIIARGKSLVIYPSSGETNAITINRKFTLGQTSLVLFSYDTAAKKLTVWVDPVLTDKAEDMVNVTPVFSSVRDGKTVDLFGADAKLNRVGIVIGTEAGTVPGNSPKFDSLRLGSGADGYYHVVGISVPPTIITQPAEKTIVSLGAPATLTVSATGVGPLLYQWTFWGNPIPGANSASLAIPGVQAANVGEYQVVVSNDGGSGSVTSNKANVLISEDILPFAITQQPHLDQTTVIEGTPVSLSVAATGTPPIKYQWRKNGAIITNGTEASFSISEAKVADSGDYDVVVTDLALNRATSVIVPLRVQIPPSIIAQPQNATSYQGGPATFVVEAEGTDLKYQWKRNGAAIAGATSPALSLSNLAAADEGAAFAVTVSNGVGSVDSLPATLTLQGSTKPDASGTTPATADATIENGANAATNLNGAGLLVCATGTTSGARKSYLAFDLPLAVATTDATSASLTLTLGNPPAFAGAGAAASPSNNPVRLRLHGIVNNNDTWSETGITWSNAPVAAESQIAPAAGTVPLAEVTVDTATRVAGDKVIFTDARIAQFLNWAAGRRSDLYGTGVAGDVDHKITFVVTSIDEGSEFAGLRFADKESGAATAPVLAFDTTAPTTPPAATVLENERYMVALADDLGVDVTDKATGATARFHATFEALFNNTDPTLSYAEIDSAAEGSSPKIALPQWTTASENVAVLGAKTHAYGAVAGTRVPIAPEHAAIRDGHIVWRFAPASAVITGFHASLELPSGKAAPRLRWTLSPFAAHYFAVSFKGLPAVANSEIDSFYMPGIWDGRRFPKKQYVIDEVRATTPAVLRKIYDQEVVTGAAVDPFEIPNRPSATKAVSYNTINNSLFGLTTNDSATTSNVPAIVAPLYGSLGSRSDGTQSFSVRLVVKNGSIDDALRDVITNIYGFHDYRRNLAGGSMNTAIDNLFDFLLDETVFAGDGIAKGYSYWRANDKANEYVEDEPTKVRFQSAPTALGLAMMRDDTVYYEKRALPTIEYFISRAKDRMLFNGYNTDALMGGPVSGYYATDFFALLGLTGGRTSAYSKLADQSWENSYGTTPLLTAVGSTLTRADTFTHAFRTWHALMAAYRATGKDAYLSSARVLADSYIKYRFTEGAPEDFADAPGSFWNQVSARWEALLEMAEITGQASYAEYGMKAMDEFVRHIHFAPAVNDLTVDGNSATTPAIKSALVSEVGLTSEGSHSSGSHRGIFMSAYAAPSLMRLAALTNDPFYAAVSRSSIVGRWLNYPGYTIRGRYYADLLSADYPLRWYTEYLNTAHMNHPAMLAAFAIDFLMADSEAKSYEAIKFPYQLSDSRIYFRPRVFGGAPGVFYGERNVWPWLPRGLVTLTGENTVQLNYIAGHGNGRLYLAFSNQSPNEVAAIVSVRTDKVTFTPGARMRVWHDNVLQNYSTFENGITTVSVSPGGLTAIAIDDVTVALDLQAGYQNGNGEALPPESFRQSYDSEVGQVTGVVLSLSPTRQSAYVYTDAGTLFTSGTDTDRMKLSSATLTYSINGVPSAEPITKNAYPFEFSVPLPADTQFFTYSVTGVPQGGGASVGNNEETLYLTTQPLITKHPVDQVKVAGEPVFFTVVTDDPGGAYQYQWYKDGAAIPGAVSASLAFVASMADDGAEYYVVVSKGLIDTVSDPATLTVTPPPDLAITTQPSGATQNAGTPYTLAVVADNATGYQWYKDGQEIPGATSATLALSGAAYESGSYHVVVHGLVGGAATTLTSDAAAVTFTPVAGVPVIRTQPQGKATVVGNAVTLTVAATGATGYQWYKDGLAINGATASTLALTGAWTDNGSYHVVVSNGAGNIVSARVMVTILPLPASITTQPEGAVVQNGSPHTLTVAVSGEADIQWRKNGVPIPGATSRTLVLSGLPSDAGVYDCVITTPSGTITSSAATITITASPDSPLAGSAALAVDTTGIIYVADAQRHIIQKITGTTAATFAGTLDTPALLDGIGVAARFNKPADIVAQSGTLYVADAGNNLIRLVQISTAKVTTLMTGSSVYPGAPFISILSNPAALAVDSAGNIYVADTGNNQIRKITPSGTAAVVTTIAGSTAGASGTTNAAGASARFNAPAGLALLEAAGASGTLFVADTGNNTIRAIALATGAVTTVAGQPGVAGCDDGSGSAALLNAPRGLVLNGSDLYIVDTGNSLVRVLSGGAVTTIAGYPGVGSTPGVPGFKDGAGTDAWFNQPQDIAIARDGTLYIADTGNKAIRTIDANDNVSTLKVTAATSGSTTPTPGGDTGGGSGGGGGGGALSLWALALLAALAGARRLIARRR